MVEEPTVSVAEPQHTAASVFGKRRGGDIWLVGAGV